MLSGKKHQKQLRRHVNQLFGAIEKREKLLDEQKLSVESGSGLTAIFYSLAVQNVDDVTSSLKIKEQFRNEAYSISEAMGRDKTVVYKVSRFAIQNAITDIEISDLILIGNGSLNDYWITNGKVSTEKYDWLKISRDSNHLKQGKFIQRTCGHLNRSQRNVPLGTFAVSELTNVVLPVGKYLDNFNPDESELVPVFHSNTNLLAQITDLNRG
jgi:hypothetical protein